MRDDAWIETFTGGVFHILDPMPEEVRIEDIAHHLSQQCRFTGATRQFYSVAEHCYHTSFLVPLPDALWALLHDASEAYICDLNSPTKHLTPIGQSYLPIEERIMSAICRRFSLPEQQPNSVRVADGAMLYAEKGILMPPMEWKVKWAENEQAANVRLNCWYPRLAEDAYLQRFQELYES